MPEEFPRGVPAQGAHRRAQQGAGKPGGEGGGMWAVTAGHASFAAINAIVAGGKFLYSPPNPMGLFALTRLALQWA